MIFLCHQLSSKNYWNSYISVLLIKVFCFDFLYFTKTHFFFWKERIMEKEGSRRVKHNKQQWSFGDRTVLTILSFTIFTANTNIVGSFTTNLSALLRCSRGTVQMNQAWLKCFNLASIANSQINRIATLARKFLDNSALMKGKGIIRYALHYFSSLRGKVW